ncbi:Mur ligase domain-containing protein, partial [Chlorobium limicola]|uniref:Mur ligase domain-containing protein n=1 Tax=Chlorobium limicola TaxID=1092 RepID=UPI000A9ED813
MTSGFYPLPFQEPLGLSEIVRELDILEITGAEDAERMIVSLTVDSREVRSGSLFVAIRGFASDGHRYISEAVRRGAAAVICESLPEDNGTETVYIRVTDSRRALAAAARAFYRNASGQILLIGVTGTNGKTTTARLIADMLNSCGLPAGYIGTNLCRIGDRDIFLERTTPEAHELQALFRCMLDAG